MSDAGLIDGGTVFSLAEIAEVQPFDQGGVILNTETGQLYSCNHVTMTYLSLLDGKSSIDTLAKVMAEEYSVPASEVGRDLVEISAELASEMLLKVR